MVITGTTVGVTLTSVAGEHEVEHGLVGRAAPRRGYGPGSFEEFWVEVFRDGKGGSPCRVKPKLGWTGCAPIQFSIVKASRVAKGSRIVELRMLIIDAWAIGSRLPPGP